MAIETTWTCDRCGVVQKNGKQMWEVGIGYRHNEMHYSDASWSFVRQVLFCRKCLIETGVANFGDTGVKPPDPLPTPVELLTTLLKEIGVKFEE